MTFCKMLVPYGPNNVYTKSKEASLQRPPLPSKQALQGKARPEGPGLGWARRAHGVGGVGWGGGVGLLKCAELLVKIEQRRLLARSR